MIHTSTQTCALDAALTNCLEKVYYSGPQQTRTTGSRDMLSDNRIYLPNKTENRGPTHRANYLGLCIEMTTSHPYAVDFEVAGMSRSQELSSISSPIHLDLPNSCLENQLCSGNKDENLYLNFHLSVQRSHHLQNIELTYQKTDMLRK